MSDAGKDKGKPDERSHELRLASVEKDSPAAPVSVDAYSLASQRRAIAYGRARGRS